jgi:hypothetical protein
VGLVAFSNGTAAVFQGKVDITGDLKVLGVSFQALLQRIQQLEQQIAALTSGGTLSGRRITVSKEGAGSSAVFVVTGAGFTANSRVVIRITDAQLHQVQFPETAGGDGRFVSRHSVSCVSGTSLTITAFEDANPQGTFANVVVTTCPLKNGERGRVL